MTLKQLQTTKKNTLVIAGATFMLLVGAISPTLVYATHPLPTSGYWAAGGLYSCYDSGELNLLKVDGVYNQYLAKIKPALDGARSTWNGQTSSFWINQAASCTSSSNWVGVDYYGLSGPSAVATMPSGAGATNQVYLNFNAQKEFGSTGGCTIWSTAWNIKWLAHHEFGHWAGFNHPTNTLTINDTVMWPNCASTWSTVQSADAVQLDSIY